MDYVIW